MRMYRSMLIGLSVLVLCSFAQGAYILTPVPDSLTIDRTATEQDRTFTLDFLLSSDAADESTTATFEVIFSKSDLELKSYAWTSPYMTGGSNDASTPDIGSLSATLSATTYGDASAVDIELSNALDTGKFGEGKLLSLEIIVPSDFPEGDVTIGVGDSPEFFNANAFGLVPASPGTDFTLTVTPEPTTLSLLALGGLAMIRRRKA